MQVLKDMLTVALLAKSRRDRFAAARCPRRGTSRGRRRLFWFRPVERRVSGAMRAGARDAADGVRTARLLGLVLTGSVRNGRSASSYDFLQPQ